MKSRHKWHPRLAGIQGTESRSLSVGQKLVTAPVELSVALTQEARNRSLSRSSSITGGKFTEHFTTYFRASCASRLTADLSTIAATENSLDICPSANEWIIKILYICTMVWFSFKDKWNSQINMMKLGIIIASKIIRTPGDKYLLLSRICRC